MDLAAALTEVYSITKRSEKTTETTSAINKALSFFTLKANFSRDLVETTLDIDTTAYGATIDLTDFEDVVRFRKFKYVRPTSRRVYLQHREPEHIFTPSSSMQTDCYFMAGTSMTYILSILDSSLEVGFYQYASTLSASDDTHWMLEMIPWVITERAAAQIFRLIGDDASANYYEKSSMELFVAARGDFEDQVAAYAS